MARAVIVFPQWTAQPWYNMYVNMCNACFVLPVAGSDLFQKVHSFPTRKPVRNEHWKFVVGFKNLTVLKDPQWEQLK